MRRMSSGGRRRKGGKMSSQSFGSVLVDVMVEDDGGSVVTGVDVAISVGYNVAKSLI